MPNLKKYFYLCLEYFQSFILNDLEESLVNYNLNEVLFVNH